MEIHHANVIYISNISRLGGVESFAYYLAKKYSYLDICVLCKSGNQLQLERIRNYCPVYVHHDQKIFCEQIIINYDTSILDFLEEGEATMVIHADYTQSCYSKLPNFYHKKLTRIFGITQYICDTVEKNFNVKCELCYNPLVLDKPQKRITLVSATRLSAIKGGLRMKRLAQELDFNKVNYIWYIFTDEQDCIHSDNVIFLSPRLDVTKWLQEADVVVQLSDTEACSYTINEALSYGARVCVTPLPYLKELNITNENAFILNFDLSNINDVVENIKHVKNKPRINWQMLNDDYIKILSKAKSSYIKELKTMKKIRVKNKFCDMQHNNIVRAVGEEFIEKADRAEDLIARGFCVFVEDMKEKAVEVETAVKEVKKEKAVKEKAIKKDAKK